MAKYRGVYYKRGPDRKIIKRPIYSITVDAESKRDAEAQVYEILKRRQSMGAFPYGFYVWRVREVKEPQNVHIADST